MSGIEPKYDAGDELLEEVIVSEDAPMDEDEVGGDDDDASTVWTDVTGDDDGIEDEDVAGSNLQPMLEEVEDMSAYTFRGHRDSVYCAAVNQVNGMIITGGGDDKSFLWTYDPISQSVDQSTVRELAGHTDTVTAVGFNFDGTLVMSGSYDGTIKVWTTSNGECILTLEGPEDIEWATWHQKGNAIIAGSSDGTIWMWLTQGGQCVQVFAGHDGGVTCGCFTSDGKTVCSGGEDGTIRIWGPKTGQCKHVFDGYNGHEATVTTICSASYDEDLLLTGSIDGTMKLYQLSGKRLLQTFIHHNDGTRTENKTAVEETESKLSVECIGFSSKDLHWVASGGLDNTMKVWDMNTGACRCACVHGGSVVSLKWHSAAPLVITAALDTFIRVWDSRTGTLVLQLTGHRDLVTCIEMVPFLQSVFTGSEGRVNPTDLVISMSDDHSAKIFHINSNLLMS